MTKARHLPTGALWIALLLGLSACGPIYDTRYFFTPPASPEGQACVHQCEQLRLQCLQYEDLKVQNCENRNRWLRLEYERCCRAGYSDCYLDSYWCTTDYPRCEKHYRFCYLSCGGQVASTTVCVANCEQAPPETRQPQPWVPAPQSPPPATP